jgi:hypothetical protein
MRYLSLIAMVLVGLAVPALSAAAQQADAGDGLEVVKIRNIDRVERRPGIDWKGYTRIVVLPVDVAFSRRWNARDYGTMGLSGAEVGRMRAGVAEITQRVFRDVLKESGLEIVEAPGEGVLAVKPDIVDLYVNSPERATAGRSRNYVMNAGEMRLNLTLSDSVTGTVLARAQDRRRGTETGALQWSNNVYNRAEAERAVRSWANQLKTTLDAARSAP